VANKPMGQDEKDRIGQAEMDERRAAEAGEASASGPEPGSGQFPDDQLEGLLREQLVAEATARGIDIRSGVTKPEIIKVLLQHPESAGAAPVEEG
jgi:hypothetical protein